MWNLSCPEKPSKADLLAIIAKIGNDFKGKVNKKTPFFEERVPVLRQMYKLVLVDTIPEAIKLYRSYDWNNQTVLLEGAFRRW